MWKQSLLSLILFMLLIVSVGASEADSYGSSSQTSSVMVVLLPRQFVWLSAEVSGRVVVIPRRLGQGFDAGDVLIELDRQYYEQELARAKAKHASAASELQRIETLQDNQVDLRAAKARVAFAEAEHKRVQALSASGVHERKAEAVVAAARANLETIETLYKNKNVSRTDWENAKRDVALAVAEKELLASRLAAELAAAKLELATARTALERVAPEQTAVLQQARSEVQLAEATVNLAQQNLTHCTIRAPFAGKVSECVVREHELVQRGTELIQVLNDDILIARFLLPSHYARRIHEGQELEFQVPGIGPVTGRIVTLDSDFDAASETVKVEAHIDNPEHALRGGTNAVLPLTQLDAADDD